MNEFIGEFDANKNDNIDMKVNYSVKKYIISMKNSFQLEIEIDSIHAKPWINDEHVNAINNKLKIFMHYKKGIDSFKYYDVVRN